MSCFVDADHARDQVTRRSLTGLLLFLGSTLIAWMSKRQNTVETSTYGAEMVAARIATEKIISVRWSLRAMGVTLMDQPCDMETTVVSSCPQLCHLWY